MADTCKYRIVAVIIMTNICETVCMCFRTLWNAIKQERIVKMDSLNYKRRILKVLYIRSYVQRLLFMAWADK